jgi:hypothetical protein
MEKLLEAVIALNEIFGAILNLASHAQLASDLIRKAHEEGRDLTDVEHALIKAARDEARQKALEATA